MTAEPRKPLLVNLTWAAVALLGLAVLYILSYAPALRFLGATDQPHDEFLDRTTLSVPERIPGYVEWMIDRTPLRGPLLLWSRLFSVEADARAASDWRTG